MSYANNYYDAESDQYNKQTLFSGGSGDLLQNKKLYNFLKPFSLALMGVSIILSLLFLVVFSFPLEFLLYVIVGNLLAWYYTAPPLKFAYRGLGEIITVIAVGLPFGKFSATPGAIESIMTMSVARAHVVWPRTLGLKEVKELIRNLKSIFSLNRIFLFIGYICRFICLPYTHNKHTEKFA